MQNIRMFGKQTLQQSKLALKMENNGKIELECNKRNIKNAIKSAITVYNYLLFSYMRFFKLKSSIFPCY